MNISHLKGCGFLTRACFASLAAALQTRRRLLQGEKTPHSTRVGEHIMQWRGARRRSENHSGSTDAVSGFLKPIMQRCSMEKGDLLTSYFVSILSHPPLFLFLKGSCFNSCSHKKLALYSRSPPVYRLQRHSESSESRAISRV